MKKHKEYLEIIIGLALVAISFNLFLSPYNFAAGGVSGLAIVIHKLYNINESIFILVMNILLILISLKFLGKAKTKNTILGSFLFPIFTLLTQNISNIIKIEIDPVIIAILGGGLSGVGYGLIFKNNYTTGGTDILNQISEKYLKIPMSKSILFIDGFVVLLGCVSFGFINMIYSLIALILISEVSNRTQTGVNKNRMVYINSKNINEIKNYLMQLNYDSTIFNSEGGYTKEKRKLIMSSISEKDYYKIKEGILLIDPKAFIIVTNAYEQKNANINARSIKYKKS